MVYPTIYVTSGPSASDPLDQSPISFRPWLADGDPHVVLLAAINWRIRLAIWFLRRYVRQATGQK